MASLQRVQSGGRSYWRIVESRRVNGKPRPVPVAYLGTADNLLERLRGADPQFSASIVVQFGAVVALWDMAQELRLVEIVEAHAPKRRQGPSVGQYMLLAALNRCVAPTSKARLADWYRGTALRRLWGLPLKALTSQRFWDHMGYLGEAELQQIQQALVERLVSHFHVDLPALFYDTTNFDTFVDTETPSALPQRGHSKSKRMDLRIVGLALMVSSDHHVPLLWEVYPGNQPDVVTFRELLDSLVERYRLLARECVDVTVVFDKGNNAEDNFARLDASDYHFIASLVPTQHADLLAVPLSRYRALSNPRLARVVAYRTQKEVFGKKRTVVLTRSEELLHGQLRGIAQQLKKRRRQLAELQHKLKRSQVPGWRGQPYTEASLHKHIATLTSGQYVRDLLKAEVKRKRGKLKLRYFTDATAFERLKREQLGKRILFTDREDWTDEQIILGYRGQYHVEDAFREMKDPAFIHFSPMFHWTDQKIRVHAFYCVVALILSTLLRRKVAQAGIVLSRRELLRELEEIRETVILYRPRTGVARKGRLRAGTVTSKMSPRQRRLYKLLELGRYQTRP